jgi:uncharacterized protein
MVIGHKARTVAENEAHTAATQMQREGMSLEQATEWLSWLAALWDDDLPQLAKAYRNEMKRLPAVYNTVGRTH